MGVKERDEKESACEGHIKYKLGIKKKKKINNLKGEPYCKWGH